MLRSTRIPETTTETHHSPRRRRDDRGLTTLEWLLIVAAVAGLAALAVVLVQNVVDDTAEQIAGSSARLTAANVAAAALTDDFAAVYTDNKTLLDAKSGTGYADVYKLWQDAADKAASACRRLNITYSDVLSDDQEAGWVTVADPPAAANVAAPEAGDHCSVPPAAG